MRLSIIPKPQLSTAQLRDATLRILAPEHSCEIGPRHFWHRPEHDRHHLALFDVDSGEFVGTVYCVIIPPLAQDFTWWLDSRMRRKGYWRPLADDLAAYLKTQRGITALGFILFGGTHLAASQKIAKRLRDHFQRSALRTSAAAR